MTTTHTTITHETLANGLVGACEHLEGVRSVGVRIFLPCGVIHEDIDARGAAPVCAELLLRGSNAHPSRDQADLFDLAGATRDASAQRRVVGVSSSVLARNAGRALELLSDMVLDPAMRDDSFDAARQIAHGILRSLDDDPQERAVLAARARHLSEPHARNPYGTEDGLKSLTPARVRAWWSEHARPTGAVVALSGAIDPGEGLDLIRSAFSGWDGAPPRIDQGPAPQRGYAHETDDTNQVQIVVVHDAPPAGHEHETLERLAVAVLSGGMSGRLFTEVRERRGLCYAVSAQYRASREHGVVTAYVGTTPERAQESLDVLLAELHRLNESGVDAEEFERARVGLKSRLVFSGESTGARAGAIAGDIDNRGAPRTLREITETIDAVTLEGLNAYLASRDLGSVTVQTLGPEPLSPPA